MARKDPAFLFYPEAFLVGVMDMTNEEVGIYIKLMCRQHQKGHIPGHVIDKVPDAVKEKFIKDASGDYYNERLESEIAKRKKYTAQRLENLRGKRQSVDKSSDMDEHVVPHMGAHMDSHTQNKNKNKNKNKDINSNKGTGEITEMRKKIQEMHATAVAAVEKEFAK